MKLTGKTLPGFRGTFSRAGKPCPVSEEHFPRRENLARFQRNIFPSGKTLLGFRGTFPRAGKPCPVSEEHFPKRENLARFQGNIFPSGKTLPGFRVTFPRVGKPCSTPGNDFQVTEKNVATCYSPKFRHFAKNGFYFKKYYIFAP